MNKDNESCYSAYPVQRMNPPPKCFRIHTAILGDSGRFTFSW